MTDQGDIVTIFRDDVSAGNESTPNPGAVGGEAGPDPAVAAQPPGLARFLPSSRGGGEGDRLEWQLENAQRDADRYRNEREDARRALDEARRRQDRQDAQMERMLEELRELRQDRFREVRESPDRDFGLASQRKTRASAEDPSEVTSRLVPPLGTSTPLRVVGFLDEDGPSPAVATDGSPPRGGLRAAATVVVDNTSVHAAASPPPVAPTLPNTSGNVTSSDPGTMPGQRGLQSRGPMIKIGSYNGETDLNAFLSKFDRLVTLYGWSEAEQIVFLEASLKGAAEEIVYEVQPSTTLADMKQMLRVRFGTDEQGEVSRTELQHTRRQPGETLQKLYRTIKKLMAVGYPGPPTSTKGWIGRDHFLRALNDEQFSVQVSIQKPKTLEEALTAALELEALGVGREGQRQRQETLTSGSSQRDRTRPPRTPGAGLAYQIAASAPETGQVIDVEALVRAVQSWTGKTDIQKSSTSPGPAKVPHKNYSDSRKAKERDSSPDRGESTAKEKRSESSAARRKFRANDVCRDCQQKGHWAYDCPVKKAAGNEAGEKTVDRQARGRVVKQAEKDVDSGTEEPANDRKIRVVKSVLPELQKLGGAVYLRVTVHGKVIYALLDTGCKHSLVGTRCLQPDVAVKASRIRLTAANRSSIPLRGETKVTLQADQFTSETTFLVSDNVTEMILGIDWLVQEDCEWSFRKKCLIARGHHCRLFVRNANRKRVRKIIARDDVTIPARELAAVPTTVIWNSIGEETTAEAMIVEPKEIADGVMITRTMIDSSAFQSALPIVNLTDKAYVVRQGDFIAVTASAGDYQEVSPSVQPARGKGISDSSTDHLQGVIDGFSSNLTSTEKAAAEGFVREYADLFSKSEFDIGRTNLVQHTIDTGQSRPFKQQLQKHPWAHQAVIDEHVDKMISSGVISPTVSPWSSNVVLVKKSSGDLRFCVDFRQLNNLTIKDSYPLPRIDSCMDSLGGAKYFSTLDLRSGYWQVELDKASSEKTAFVTRRGIYKFNVLAFGLSNAPAIFQ